MSGPEVDASTIVSEYLRDRREQMAERHEVFSDKPIRPLPSIRTDSMRTESRETPEPGEKTENFMTELTNFNRYMDEVSRESYVDFDVRNCGWSDVLGKMRDANGAVAQRMERDKTPWSKGAMALTDMSDLLQPMLQGIPDELFFLHGGLALLFHLAKHRDKVKRDIINVFEEVVFSLAVAGNAMEDTADDVRLHEALNRLRLTLLETIPCLINILVPEKPLAKVTAFFKSSKADSLLDKIQRDAKRVEMRARSLGDQLASEASRITKDHVEEIHDELLGLQDQQQCILDMVRCSLASQDGMTKMLCEVVGVFNYNRTRRRTSSTSTTRARSPSLISTVTSPVGDSRIVTLKIILGVQSEHVVRDLNYVRKQEREFDQKSKLTAATIFVDPKFIRWMNNGSSDLIYVEGRLEKYFDKTSPISYFCAVFVHQFKEGPHTTATLSFFCGQHVASHDGLRGPRGLMRSLIVQVLRIWPLVNLDDPDLASFNGATDHQMISIEQLCLLFYIIVGQIPSHYTIFCVIDDVNRLEREEWGDEYWVVMNMLEDMVKRSPKDVGFKVLMTSPARSRFLRGENNVHADHRILVTDSGPQIEPKIKGLRM